MSGFKNIRALLALVTALALLAGGGCNNSSPSGPSGNNNDDDPPDFDGTVTFTFDGVVISFTNAGAAKDPDTDIISIGALDNDSGESFTLHLPDTPGTITVLEGEPYTFLVGTNGSMYIAEDNQATIELDTVSATQVAGTFSGLVTDFFGDEGDVTNGSFTVDYVVLPPLAGN